VANDFRGDEAVCWAGPPRANWAQDIDAHGQRTPQLGRICWAPTWEKALPQGATLNAMAIGVVRCGVFARNCRSVTGRAAQGQGYFPNLSGRRLLLWGGAMADIRIHRAPWASANEQDADARYSQMPAFGRDIGQDDIAAVD